MHEKQIQSPRLIGGENERIQVFRQSLVSGIAIAAFLLLATWFFVADKSDHLIAKHIRAKFCADNPLCENLNCVVDMREILSDEWDSMYIFNIGCDPDEIIGFEVNLNVDLTSSVAFVNSAKKKMVYSESYLDVDELEYNTIVFDIGKEGCVKMNRDSAIFEVESVVGRYFILRHRPASDS